MQSWSSSGDNEDESQDESDDSDLADFVEASAEGMYGFSGGDVPQAMGALMMSPLHPM